MKNVTIQQTELKIVRGILSKFIPDREVRVFGSRYNGTVKPFSDLDLVIMGDTPVNNDIMNKLREAFSESEIPFKIDLVEWNSVKQTFRNIIDQGNEIIFP